MDALKIAIAALTFAFAPPARADSVDAWHSYIAEASARFGIPERWIARVMRAESGGRTMLNGRSIISRAGARGLMQLMPGTWTEMRARLGLGANPHDPRDNILAGTAYLRRMYDRFGYPGLFAAYNAGPGRYAEHLATGRSLPGETRAYLVAVADTPDPAPQPATQSGRAIFFALRSAPEEDTGPEDAPAGDRLFVVRRTAPQGQ
jgi:soluble lytic murein transglycosylase-like protein